MKRRLAGVTLIEILVSLGLIIIVSAMLIALFIPSMSLFRRQSGKSDAYRGCLMMMERFRIGLMNSQMETVTVLPTGHTMSWQIIEESPPFSAATGDALMSSKFAVIHYDEVEKKVYLKEYQGTLPNGPEKPSFLAIPELELAANTPSEDTWVLARDIVNFEITDKDGDLALLEAPLQLTITCEIDTKGTETNDVEAFTLTSSVTPRSMRW